MTRNEIEKALRIMVQVVANRDDGKCYIPIVLRLEHEMEKLREVDTEYERIVKMAV